uniref:Uncharacterized protein n=1 Tax=viral metagenome TaxID=1070528 RepID=A0A6C0DSH6_9ZZZZ
MSARLNMNEIPIIPWKGKTFTQITSRIIKNNTKVSSTIATNILFNPMPLKIYRKEIVTGDVSNCYQRTSVKIDDINRPNGTIVNTSKNNPKDLVMTLDYNLVNNNTEAFGKCLDPNECVATNARRRVRSSGIIKRQFDITKNNDTYYTSTNQYLVSRNRKFDQNQYNYVRIGDSKVTPGDALSVSNIYSANGINHCQRYYIQNDVSFQYQWVDTLNYTVTVPHGYYQVEDLNHQLKLTMDSNYHYLLDATTQSHIYLLNIAYNTFLNVIELQVTATGGSIYAAMQNNISMPKDAYGAFVNSWTMPTYAVVPGFIILNNAIQQAIGFNAGNYPNTRITAPTNTQTNPIDQVFTSIVKPGIQPLYIPIFYKPNNPQFAQQGGVSSSSLILRKRYNTITCNTQLFRGAYGVNIDNAVAYGVGESGYTKKDKIGYPNTTYPKIPKYGPQICTFSKK